MPTSQRPGMGANVYPGGCAFRVWAPHAESVAVVGDFNGWDAAANPLEAEDGGYWSVNVKGAKHGQEYKFVLRNADQELWRIDPYARQVTNSIGNGVVHDPSRFDWQDDTFVCPSHNTMVIYEMHVGSFAREGDEAGTLEGVVSNLDHLSKLNVNCLQLMPVMEFAGDTSWGYNPAHIFAIESSYGGPDALKTLVREAHKRGISVIVDVVYNHLGPSDLDLWRFDGWSENEKGGIYFYNDWKSETPWGDTRPDYGRGEVRQFLRDNALSWFEEYHVQGLRFDMTPYMRSVSGMNDDIPEGHALCRWITDEIRAHHPDAITIAEDLHGEPMVTSSGPEGAGFHAQWDNRFVHPVRAAIITGADEARSVQAVSEAITHGYGDDAFSRVIYTESHDEVANGKARVVEEINPDDPGDWFAQKRSTLGAAIVMTAPGIPMLFQGQEFLQGDWFQDNVPLNWDQNAEYHGIVRLYRDLVMLRLNGEGDTRGLMGQHTQILHANDESKVLAYHRSMDGGPGDDVVVVANFSNQTWGQYRIGMPMQGEWRLRVNSDARIYSDRFGDQDAWDVASDGEPQDDMPCSAVIQVAPYSVLVYSRTS